MANVFVQLDGVGRLVLPKATRRRLRLQRGSRLRLVEDAQRLILEPVEETSPLREVSGLLLAVAPLAGPLVDHRELRTERLDALAGLDRR